MNLLNRSNFESILSSFISDHVNKDSAVIEVNSIIEKLLKIRQYRYYQEDDIETLQQISIYRELLARLESHRDWESVEIIESKISLFFKRIKVSILETVHKYLDIFKKPQRETSPKLPQNNLEVARLIAKNKAAKDALEISRIDRLTIEAAERKKVEQERQRKISEHLAMQAKLKLQTEILDKPREVIPITYDIPEISESHDEPVLLEPTDDIEKIISKSAWLLDGDVTDSISGLHGKIVTRADDSIVNSQMNFGEASDGSLYFESDGTNFISLPENSLNFKEDFSVSFRLFVPSDLGKKGIIILSSFDNRFKHDEYFGFYINYSNNTINVGMAMTYSESPNFTFADFSIKDRWAHVAVTRKKSGSTRIYIEHELVAETKSEANPVYAQNNLAYIGASYYSLNSPQYSINAAGFKLSSIQTWDGLELTQGEVDELYGVVEHDSLIKKIFNFSKK